MDAKTNIQQIKSLLSAEATKNRFFEILGKKSVGFISSVLNVVNSNALLQEADPQSVMMSAAIAATLDLPINPNLGFAAIVPYRDAKNRTTVAQFQMMWRGFVQLSQRSG
ncbi:recombination and repair protein RecT [Bacteroidales bacterium Barb6]|nr:recombination and repair protein RecT [Bacteroidales bacterium Barb6]